MLATHITTDCARRSTRAAIAVLGALACAPGAHADAPLNYFLHADGPAAMPTMHLGWALAALAVAVALIVSVLLAGAILRKRPPPTELDARHVQAEGGGLHWVWIGTGISSVALFAALAYVLVTLESVASPRREPGLTIAVTAYDWWWRIDYVRGGKPEVTTANEIHIPVGEPVKIELRSADVVHAFWVPRLAGKTQTIPGIVNEQWIEADRAGVYRGQCSQFCGAQHAHMAFEVIAEPHARFDAWYAAQALPHASEASARAGEKLFLDRCAGCHAVRGSDANGRQAPDLTHLNSRRLIAAGALPNTAQDQLDWIQHAQRIKPDSLMPSIALSPADAIALSAYLRTLQ
ncbi:cytochrome c oxidase subunit II [Caballeronia ptereochthonis]|uniref:Cytochrome aa3 subunit 2 n=1 Tax=Caballeronia ptereochthonis TaxID=1777144 RepID=A0A158B4J2_9BURK|nr:cytochrome c oxidase subunit II [Caballeronia ptereochthonis]SAK65005.1 cytochrome c oxidase polypeptide II [Caballeronia ptereochthonis]